MRPLGLYREDEVAPPRCLGCDEAVRPRWNAACACTRRLIRIESEYTPYILQRNGADAKLELAYGVAKRDPKTKLFHWFHANQRRFFFDDAVAAHKWLDAARGDIHLRYGDIELRVIPTLCWPGGGDSVVSVFV